MAKLILLIAGISGGVSVMLGAFAAHGLKKKISADMLTIFKTGVDYQFYHTFALALVGLSPIKGVRPLLNTNHFQWFRAIDEWKCTAKAIK